MKTIHVRQKVTLIQTFEVLVPEDIKPSDFIEQLADEDPYCNDVEVHNLERLNDTEDVLISEFRLEYDDEHPIMVVNLDN